MIMSFAHNVSYTSINKQIVQFLEFLKPSVKKIVSATVFLCDCIVVIS